ncbi:domain of Kin17 curved DNA-binding protein-domain-containing protein [Melampsora americana]|nr:domain of Kin17 curved DNA-binding protein-domain-containing protein [Melampsora americana]
MPKAEKGTPKAIANAMKSKGLQRLRWYCQVCEKQCRDENGFKCHAMSEGHLRQMLVVGENAGKYINNYSEDFKRDFLALISRRWGTKRVLANMVYQEYIADKNHSHMNATQWVTLTEFCKQMGREGILNVDETEKGWYISWIDSSPKALAKQASHLAKERSEMDDEERMRKLISEQIEKAKNEESQRLNQSKTDDQSNQVEKILNRDTINEPIQLNLKAIPIQSSSSSSKPTDPQPNQSTSTPGSIPAQQSLTSGIQSISNTQPKLKQNPFKKHNPLKSSSTSSKKTESSISRSVAAPKSALESIIAEEEARKRKMNQVTWSGPSGHGEKGLQLRGHKR